jgi:hypothetical protein
MLYRRIKRYILPPYHVRHLDQQDLFGTICGTFLERRYIIHGTVGKAFLFQPAAAEGMPFCEYDQAV